MNTSNLLAIPQGRESFLMGLSSQGTSKLNNYLWSESDEIEDEESVFDKMS
jgi:hypothetical protein